MLILSHVIQTVITVKKQPERRKKRKGGRKVARKAGITDTWSTPHQKGGENQKGSTPTANAYQSERKKAAH